MSVSSLGAATGPNASPAPVFDYGRIDGVAGNPNVTPEFIAEVEAMAARLGTRPEYLMAVMSFESGGSFDPGVKNAAGSGATGLIQFMPATAQGLGTSIAALERMSPLEQLAWVEKYFEQRADPGDLGTLEGVYTSVLYGSPRPDPSSVLFDTGDGKAYTQNAGLDHNRDGRITAGEATASVRGRVDGDLAGGAPAPAPTPSPGPVPGPAPEPAPAPGGSVVVRPGDTLSGIAAANGVGLDALLAANPQIGDADFIHPGQQIQLPGGDPAPAQGSVTVRADDTLSGIAAAHGVPLGALLAANPQLRNPDLIYPGQQIRLSAAGTAAADSVTVRAGDTLSGIASANGVSLGALLAANPQIRDPDLIHPGQQVHLPGGAAPGAAPSPAPASPAGDAPRYAPYTVYSTGESPAIRLDGPQQMQPHHDYTTRNRDGQLLEVRDLVLDGNGTPQTAQAIPSPIDGRVIHAGPMGDAGNAVIVQGGDGQLVYLFHMSSIDVREGQQVGYGQALGNQGSTGHSTGPHVHIEAAGPTIDRWVNDLLDGRFDGVRG
ncbi:LysM peptidoglycan-binding domain-containing protein [Coralloluteibacterium stylophorae]|uniref:LysM peptidoglycan-binding domain-containing protein n=1 Tax=Coralloluteibacterium stylophorae TaxID=1776034 RepID=A0A8J8AXQ9_9GAMM|nr:LysM peptidoglycan-binding domain-containing protein [Coralloluteibacterium stylophorae]MBS7458782.1 LysM peptidoglycan-binding domain-containing protein [Coralloluteibacterium stylophorae]